MSSGFYEADAEVKLAELMQRDLGVTVTPRELRMFIRANWRKLSVLAHAIHGSEGQRQVDSKRQSGSNDCDCMSGTFP